MEGEIFNGKTPVYRIDGKWNEGATLINVKTGDKEQAWVKNPYPDKWEYMYGMTNLMLQCNYFPKRLKNRIAPTDTRWRPD